MLGAEVGTLPSSLWGLAFALAGAALISFTRGRSKTVPQEAFIGVAYVVAAAAAILVLTRVPHGAEETEALLVGSILWANWTDVLQAALLYAGLGLLIHRLDPIFRRITEDPETAQSSGVSLRLWDFLFYAILGVTVTYSVQIAGVFLVFAFLVVPSVMAELLQARRKLLTGWILGGATAIAGTSLSYALDLPTGATIVCSLGLVLLIIMAIPSRDHR